MKISHPIFVVLVLAAALTSSMCESGETGTAQHAVAPEWEISAYGLGPALGPGTTPADLRRLFSDAEVILEPSPGEDASGYTPHGRYVVKRDGQILFTSPCGCHLSRGIWTPNQTNLYKTTDDVVLHLSTQNPRYRTKEGIGVGSTVAELRKAYSQKKFDLLMGQRFSDEPTVACFIRKNPHAARTSPPAAIESLEFALDRPTSLLERNRLAAKRPRPNRFDPKAKITEVTTAGNCGARLDLMHSQ